MATFNSLNKPFDDLLNFISNQPKFPAAYSSLKIPLSPPSSCEITTFYITIHREKFIKSIFVKKILVWLVSAFVLLTGKEMQDLVMLLV